MIMSEIAIMLILSGWHCPPVECAEVFIDDVYSILCVEGREYEPLTGPYSSCVRIDIAQDDNS